MGKYYVELFFIKLRIFNYLLIMYFRMNVQLIQFFFKLHRLKAPRQLMMMTITIFIMSASHWGLFYDNLEIWMLSLFAALGPLVMLMQDFFVQLEFSFDTMRWFKLPFYKPFLKIWLCYSLAYFHGNFFSLLVNIYDRL